MELYTLIIGEKIEDQFSSGKYWRNKYIKHKENEDRRGLFEKQGEVIDERIYIPTLKTENK